MGRGREVAFAAPSRLFEIDENDVAGVGYHIPPHVGAQTKGQDMTSEQYRAEKEAIAKATESILEAVDGLSVRLAKAVLQDAFERIEEAASAMLISKSECVKLSPIHRYHPSCAMIQPAPTDAT